MPNYTFIDNTTGEETTHMMKISELDGFKKDNPHLTQKLTAAGFVDPIRAGITRTPDSFNSLLKHIKKGNSVKGGLDSAIRTR